jgi:hypothetical protein
MVCLGNICINTLHKGAKDDDDDDDDNNNNHFQSPVDAYYILILRVFLHYNLKNQRSDHSAMKGQGSVPAGPVTETYS